MRGSPLLRSFIIVLLLAGFAIVLTRLTATTAPQPTSGPRKTELAAPIPPKQLPYRLTFSAEPADVKLSAGDQAPVTASAGNLEAGPQSPIFLTVRWKVPVPAGEHRFVKLVLEPIGKPTITHVFDAEGDIDDVFELP